MLSASGTEAIAHRVALAADGALIQEIAAPGTVADLRLIWMLAVEAGIE
jgi:hypothetical protein